MNSLMKLYDPTEGSPPCVLCLLTTTELRAVLRPVVLVTFAIKSNRSVWFFTKNNY